MRREEIKNIMFGMEHSFLNQPDRAIRDMKEDLRATTTGRQQLEAPILQFEQNSSKKKTPQRMLAMKDGLTKQ